MYFGAGMLALGIFLVIVGTYLRDKAKEKERLEEAARIREGG